MAVKSIPPLYAQIYNILKNEISRGIYPAGSLLPPEDVLCDRFLVSRHTLREALRLLKEEGMLASRRGAGTLVVPPGSPIFYTHQLMSVKDISDFASNTRLIIESVQMVSIDQKLSLRTALLIGEEWLQVRGYRYLKGENLPISQVEYYINRVFADIEKVIPHNVGTLFELIEDLFGQKVAAVQQQTSATLLTEDMANNLKEKKGAAALQIRRIYKTVEKKIMQVTINTHPACRYQHSMLMLRTVED